MESWIHHVLRCRMYLAARLRPEFTTVHEVLSVLTPSERKILDEYIETKVVEAFRRDDETFIDDMADPTGLFGGQGMPHLAFVPMGVRRGQGIDFLDMLMGDFPFDLSSLVDMDEGLPQMPSSGTDTMSVIHQLIKDLEGAAADDMPIGTSAHYLQLLHLDTDRKDGYPLILRMMEGRVVLSLMRDIHTLIERAERLMQRVENKASLNQPEEVMLVIFASICDKQLTREGLDCPITNDLGKRLMAVRPELLSDTARQLLATL